MDAERFITILSASFVFSGIPYRVVIIPMKKLSIAMATVNPWVCVSGELSDSGVRQVPKNTQEIFFQVRYAPLFRTTRA